MAEDGGDSAFPSAVLCAPDDLAKRQRLGPSVPVEEATDGRALDSKRFLICELFAGEGVLTSAMLTAGVPVRPPEDLAGGGTDFEDKLSPLRTCYAASLSSLRRVV